MYIFQVQIKKFLCHFLEKFNLIFFSVYFRYKFFIKIDDNQSKRINFVAMENLYRNLKVLLHPCSCWPRFPVISSQSFFSLIGQGAKVYSEIIVESINWVELMSMNFIPKHNLLIEYLMTSIRFACVGLIMKTFFLISWIITHIYRNFNLYVQHIP